MAAQKGLLTPVAAEVLNKNKYDSVGTCRCFGDGNNYEVDCLGKTYVVDLGLRSCGCNMWELTGIPCSHAICCMMKNKFEAANYVHHYYHRTTFLKVYELSVNPMPGEDQWEKTDFPPLDPPKLVIQPGRPKKSRKREVGEAAKSKSNDPSKVSRVRHGPNRCGNCHELGHTRKSCKNSSQPPPSKPAAKKPGRPSSENTLPQNPKKRKYTKKVQFILSM